MNLYRAVLKVSLKHYSHLHVTGHDVHCHVTSLNGALRCTRRLNIFFLKESKKKKQTVDKKQMQSNKSKRNSHQPSVYKNYHTALNACKFQLYFFEILEVSLIHFIETNLLTFHVINVLLLFLQL